MSALRWLSLSLLALALVAGAGFALRHQETGALRQEIALLREENGALARLRTETLKLKATQTPTAELERLRNERAAIERLRAEVETMKARAEKRAP